MPADGPIEDLQERLRAVKRVSGVLTEAELWTRHDACIYEADGFEGRPFFYPVYRKEGYYSYSILPLILKTGYVRVNPEVGHALARPENDVLHPDIVIDRDIERIGGPPTLTREHSHPAEFAGSLAQAMQADVDAVQDRNPGYANVVLCGGKDSLNLLLLDWKGPVTAYSAAPNFTLVREFVERNGLAVTVEELRDDEDPALREREIAEGGCFVRMENWRWTTHLRRIAAEHDRGVVFWKGQFADAFLTDYWRSYSANRSRFHQLSKRAYRQLARRLPAPLLALPDRIALHDFRAAIWERGAVMQGAHMGFLRSITDCLFVSGYHGPRTGAVWLAADLPSVTSDGLRDEIGRLLLGREVWYPAENPSPGPSRFRAGWRSVDRFVAAVRSFGVEVRN